jgi:hypothetical protein
MSNVTVQRDDTMGVIVSLDDNSWCYHLAG